VLPGLGGLAVSEAMVYGLPVIVSIGDGCEVDLVDESNGFRNPDLNEVDIFNYLEYLYLNPDKLQEMKQNSINKIRTTYNIEAYVERILDSFKYVSQN
jgi:glycosyltransferase involved in cell wall biosynthesis